VTSSSPFHPHSSQNVNKHCSIRNVIEVKFQWQKFLFIVLDGYVHWCLALRGGSYVCESRETREIFGLKTDKLQADWRKVHNAVRHDFHPSLNINPVIKWWRMTWAGHVTRIGEVRNTHGVLVGKPEGRRTFGKPKCRWGTILKRISNKYNGRTWNGFIYTIHDRDKWLVIVKAVIKFRLPHCGQFLD
jgi:hypothetical protein